VKNAIEAKKVATMPGSQPLILYYA